MIYFNNKKYIMENYDPRYMYQRDWAGIGMTPPKTLYHF
jgi:hypothetical protein